MPTIDWSVVDDPKKKKRKGFLDFSEEPGKPQIDWGDSVTSGKDWQDFTKGEAMWYVTQKGLADTYRGGKQLLGIDEEEMAEAEGTDSK